MPRYYRRRYTRVVKPKKKWATNIREITISEAAVGGNKAAVARVLCVNGPETTGAGSTATAATPTPTIIKTGNYKVQCDVALGTSAGALVSAFVYVVYVPEGVFASANLSADYAALTTLLTKHPEWILAWRQVSSDLVSNQANLDRVTFSSRLKRNLNSGDGVYFVVTAISSTSNLTTLDVRGFVQFWTCAN